MVHGEGVVANMQKWSDDVLTSVVLDKWSDIGSQTHSNSI